VSCTSTFRGGWTSPTVGFIWSAAPTLQNGILGEYSFSDSVIVYELSRAELVNILSTKSHLNKRKKREKRLAP
jgi:hypothetical protein